MVRTGDSGEALAIMGGSAAFGTVVGTLSSYLSGVGNPIRYGAYFGLSLASMPFIISVFGQGILSRFGNSTAAKVLYVTAPLFVSFATILFNAQLLGIELVPSGVLVGSIIFGTCGVIALAALVACAVDKIRASSFFAQL